MQLYRPGQSRLKAPRSKNEEGGGADRPPDGGDSSSSSVSPIMGVAGGSEPHPVPAPPQDFGGGGKSYASGKGYERKAGHGPHKYREPRGGGSHYWEGEREGVGEGRGGGTSKGGPTRKGYSYHHERESKGKWSARGQKDQDTASSASSQFKSLTFRRSTSQE